jgi:hypothetical protein
MKTPVNVVPFLILLAACSANVPNVPPTQISGNWGGQNVSIHDSVSAKGIVLNVGCWEALFPGPVEFDSAGTFTATGAIFAASWDGMVGTPARISGAWSEQVLTLNVSTPNIYGIWETPLRYRLSANQTPTWHVAGCTV